MSWAQGSRSAVVVTEVGRLQWWQVRGVEIQASKSLVGMVMDRAAGGCRLGGVPRLGCKAIDILNTKLLQTVRMAGYCDPRDEENPAWDVAECSTRKG
jgi:hypothetical protein